MRWRCSLGLARAGASELQSALARRVGERLDAAVILPAAAVECDLRDSRGLGSLGDRAADLLGGGDVPTVLQLPAHVLEGARRRRQRPAGRVVDQLRVNVL